MEARDSMLEELDRVVESLGETGAARRAAEVVLRELQGSPMNENQAKAG
jgi:hypothetical protein